jgi:hypothetical protein
MDRTRQARRRLAPGVRDREADVVKRIAFGFCAVALYAVAVAVTHVPVRPLYDGSGPPLPYNWMKPPSGFKNTKPKPFSQNVDLGPKGIVGANLATSDGQAVLITPEGSFPRHGADKSVHFRFVPLDPSTIKPPAKPKPQGNAYRITATYEPSGANAVPTQPITVLLRYPATAATVLRLNGTSWTMLKSQNLASTLQIYANTTALGTFVAAGGHSNTLILWYITGGISLIAAILGLVLGLRERRAGPSSGRN